MAGRGAIRSGRRGAGQGVVAARDRDAGFGGDAGDDGDAGRSAVRNTGGCGTRNAGADGDMKYDCIVIGAGHNGLTAAGYLAGRGKKVIVLERRDVVGGAALTTEFEPGFRNSEFSYVVSLLDSQVIRDLELRKFGLEIINREGGSMSFGPKGHLWLPNKVEDSVREIAKRSRSDATNYAQLDDILEKVCVAVRRLMRSTPYNVTDSFMGQIGSTMRTGRVLAGMDGETRAHLAELMTKSVGDYLDQWFETDILKGTLAYSGSVGNFVGPYHPSTAYVLLHHVFGQVEGKTGAWGHARGGMGSITQAMRRSAEARGVVIRTEAEVAGAMIDSGRIRGVRLRSGEEIGARAVIANCHPQILFERIVGYDNLPPDFSRRIKGYRSQSGSFRMNLALSGLPEFTGLKGGKQRVATMLNGSNNVMPSIGYIQRAYDDALEHGWARKPVIEFCIPSLLDDSLAPKGCHVMSLFCQHFRRHLPGGASWDDKREDAAKSVIDAIEEYAPNIRRLIVGMQINTPLDIERKLNMVGGDIFHGALHLDQLYSMRPVVGAAGYRMPIKGLYLGGSGAHPGGGVSGLPGSNCAREVLRDI